jgi:kelch-like protein 19
MHVFLNRVAPIVSGLSACVVKGSFYVVGGRNNSHDGNMDCNSLEMYDSLRKQWVTKCPMSVPRNRVGVGVIDNMIYAVGGLINTFSVQCICYKQL